MAVIALGSLSGCNPGPDLGWQSPRLIDLGMGSNLNAVAIRGFAPAEAVAVGSAGTVLAWSIIWGDDFDSKPVVTPSIPADVELRGVADAGGTRWVVVGDGGFAAVTKDSGDTWTVLGLGTSANLRAAVAVDDDTVIVVGDEVVRVLRSDGTWLGPTAPQAGWGQLRAVGSSLRGVDTKYVVGLNGAISSTTDPSGVWTTEDSGVVVDLFGVGSLGRTVAAVGASGTFLVREGSEWIPIETERTADFIDYLPFIDSGVVLTADGEILEFDIDDPGAGFQPVGVFAGARDLAVQPPGIGLLVVGDAGLAVSIDYVHALPR